jgi:Mad3/BUB1 homology region 1.
MLNLSPLPTTKGKVIQSNAPPGIHCKHKSKQSEDMHKAKSKKKFNRSSGAITVTPYEEAMTEHKNLDRNIIELESLVRPSEYFAERYKQLQGNDSWEPNKREVRQLINDCQVSDDPILHWINYINYLKTKYSNDDEFISSVYQRCVNALVCIKKYKSDERFIRLCITYADRSKRTLKEFDYFYKMKIGVSHAMMWMCWAWSAEKHGDYKLADNVFRKALEKKIEPVALVSERFQQFWRRIQLREEKVLQDGISGGKSAAENKHVSRTHLQKNKSFGSDKEDEDLSTMATENDNTVAKRFRKGAKRQKVTLSCDILALQDVTNSCLEVNTKKRHSSSSYNCISVNDELGDESCFERERAKMGRVVFCKGNNFNSLSRSFSTREKVDDTCTYDYIHANDIQNAIQVLSSSKRQTNVHLRNEDTLPKCLLKCSKKRTSFKLGSSDNVAFHKLGSGSNGTVFLCASKNCTKHDGIFALKVQSPVGCLAWEYMVLAKLKTRLKHFNLIPNVASISLFGDGGAMQMTAGSKTGFTLLDLVNLYKGNVPELLAIHYTHRMLTVIEILHLRGKILVSCISPR